MRWALLLLLAGCRQIFGIDDPHVMADALVVHDASPDVVRDGAADAASGVDCTMLPTPPPDQVDETQNAGATALRIKNFKAASGGTKYAIVPAGQTFVVNFDYVWVDTSCASNCVDQIEIGYVPGDRVGCPFDGLVVKGLMTSGMTTYTLTAPAMLGWTSIRIAIGQNTSCTGGGAHTWFEGPPPPTEIVGYVCSH